MGDLGCHDTEWLGGHERYILHAILLRNGLILAPLSMDKGKCGCLGCISGWLGALRRALRVTVGGLRVLGYSVVRWK